MTHAQPRTLAANAAGLGLRRAILGPLQAAQQNDFDFLECAPDNWIGAGGKFAQALEKLRARWPLLCHGLSLSLGGVEPFDHTYLRKLRQFLDRYQVAIFSEHLSYCADDGQLYDLLPIPFTEAAVDHVVRRIDEVQNALGRRIAIENISYYAAPYQAMAEIDFIGSILARSDCDLLLDVNNIYVNSVNHRYDPIEFLEALPSQRIAYIHVAGHEDEAEDLKVDTHGAPVRPEVWQLLAHAYHVHGLRPTLLERDFNLPPFDQLLDEVTHIRQLQQPFTSQSASRYASA